MLQNKPQRSRAARMTALALVALCSTTLLVAQTAKSPAKQSGGTSHAESKKVFEKVEEMPEFKTDVSAWLSDHLKYPDSARLKGSEGRVIIRFIVSDRGQVRAAEVLRSSGNALLDAEALRVVSIMPDWKPGKSKGTPVNVYYHLPITFKLA